MCKYGQKLFNTFRHLTVLSKIKHLLYVAAQVHFTLEICFFCYLKISTGDF